MASTDPPAPTFTIVTAVYNVDRYLDDFFESIHAQQHNHRGISIEIVAVDDGSTDESPATLERWQRQHPETVKVVRQENRGQGAARNLGLTLATGEWVTFTDPDDTLAPDYFSQVAACIDDNPDVAMVATARILHEEKEGRRHDGHPLRAMFATDRVLDLNRFPTFFHGSAPAAFFRLDWIREFQLHFDDRIRPNFEDGHFCGIYLLRSPQPVVAFLGSAHYYYRKRADQSSTLQTSRSKPSRYTDVPRYGYLGVLREGARLYGRAPEWAQNFIIYELSWYFQEDSAMASTAGAIGDVGAEFISILREISQELDDDVITGFSVRSFKQVWREALLHGLRGRTWHTPYVIMQRYQRDRRMLRIAYRYTGELPKEEFLDDEVPVTPASTKSWSMGYFGQPVVQERVVWLPIEGTLRVRLDNRGAELRTSTPGPPRMHVQPSSFYAERTPSPPRRTAKFKIGRSGPQTASGKHQISWLRRKLGPKKMALLRKVAANALVRRLFRDLWLVSDRVEDADDNGERLFEYLRTHRRDINAWFVLKKGTPDWDRMRRAGHRRLVPYGTWIWKIMMLDAQHVISSHCDLPVYRPRAVTALGPVRYRFTFLQHGVIKDDISRYLNQKEFDLMVTTTKAEHESIVGDASPYRLSERETKRVGLARFDRLVELASAQSNRPHKLVLIAPTWRDHLNLPLARGAYKREVRPDFAETDYAKNWLGLLAHPRREALAAEGYRIGFLPHPNVQSILPKLNLPSWVEPLSFDGDVQRLFAQCALMVTDYSSTVFNAAVANRPVVYFQFDADEVAQGSHIGRAGYFDYVDDGFGPVTRELDEAASEIERIARGGIDDKYQRRIDETFDLRDGRCCERTVNAIEDLTRTQPTRE